jgi:dynein heavy chain
LLKTSDFKWQQPPNQKSGNDPKNSESKIGAPEPRANHTANFHKGKVYIFGGHGGVGYERTAFNDLYYFDIETSEWTKLDNIEGALPGMRGGHTSAMLTEQEMLMIYGGWSNTS